MALNTNTGKKTVQIDTSKPIFKKYLVISDSDRKWGFIINNTGKTVIKKNANYPSKGHPGAYLFSWEKGRILNEFHFVLISEGEGVFESSSMPPTAIKGGDGFLIFPGEWHRYKPLKKTGWTEYWVGFTGEIPDLIMKEHFFQKEQAVIPKCGNQVVLNLFKSLFQLIEEEPFGFQRIASGVCLQMIAEICNAKHGASLNSQKVSVISRAKYVMHEKIDSNIDFERLADNLGISYSKFRADFKKQTGLSPLQYFLLLKIEKAKNLLLTSTENSRQIAFTLGFESDYYFCRLFKSKTGLTPKQFRVMELNKGQNTNSDGPC